MVRQLPPSALILINKYSGEEKPACLNCQRQGETCDYSIRLNWEGRTKKKSDNPGSGTISFGDDDDSNASGTPEPGLPPMHGIPMYTSNPLDPQQYGQEPMHYQPPFNGQPRGQLPPPQMMRQSFTTLDPSGSWYPGNNMGQDGSSHMRGNSMGQYDATGGMAPGPQFRNPPYPSPAESGLGSPGSGHIVPQMSSQMLPPYPNTSQPSKPVGSQNGDPTYDDRSKRMRLSPRFETSNLLPRNRFNRASSYGPGDLDEHQRTPYQPLTPTFYPSHLANPLTPDASSTMSDDTHNRWMPKPFPPVPKEDPDVRRVSVNSLLSDPQDDEIEETPPAPATRPPSLPYYDSPSHRRTDSNATDTYGLDRGHPDLDLPKNNDAIAISGMSPSEASFDLESPYYNDYDFPEFGFGVPRKETVFAKGGYYAQPVPIKIPRSLEPLPSTLLQNPMNLLYFHHFLNHTARILVPHDCSANPFKTILPQSKTAESPY
jgi:hypothetical protein